MDKWIRYGGRWCKVVEERVDKPAQDVAGANGRTILHDLEKITDNHPYSGLAAEALWRVDAWVRERYAQELPPPSMPWWHRCQHQWDMEAKFTVKLKETGGQIATDYLLRCTRCGALRNHRIKA